MTPVFSPPVFSLSHSLLRRLSSPRPLSGTLTALSALCALGAPFFSSSPAVAAAPSALQAQALTPSLAPIVSQVSPAVVSIAVRGSVSVAENAAPARPSPFDFFGSSPFGFRADPFERFAKPEAQRKPPSRPIEGRGSGFLIAADGHIVTNHHVIAGAESITVALSDGREFPATLIGSDQRTDLAVVKIDSADALPFVAFDLDDDVRVGDWVFAVGNPFGLGGTVTSGIVSAHGRDIGKGEDGGGYGDFIQIDAPINRGNSGGPAFNLQGEVIGVNTAIYSPGGGNVGIGFASPASTARVIVAELIEKGRVERGYLGVRIQTLNADIAEALGRRETGGVLIAEVTPDSAAERAGLAPGDAVIALNGEKLDDVNHLSRSVALLDPQMAVTLDIWRDGDMEKVDVVLGAAPGADAPSARQNPAAPEGSKRYGLSLAPVDEAAKRRFGLSPDADGVIVSGVDPDGAAARAGLRAGDLIVEVDGEAIRNPEDVVAKLAAKKRSTLVLVAGPEGRRYIAIKPQA